MGVYTDIMQDKIRREEKSKKELIKEIETLSKKLEEKENTKQYEKDYKTALLLELENLIFSKFDKLFAEEKQSINYIKIIFFDFEIRNDIINMIAKGNSIDSIFLDNNYDKIVEKVYNKYKKHLTANPHLLKPQFEELDKLAAEMIEKSNKNYMKQKRKNQKGFFEVFLNLILRG